MDDLVSLFQARRTITEMLSDRGYHVPEDIKCHSLEQFKVLFHQKQFDVLVKDPNPCYVKFVLLHKARPTLLREYINQIREKEISENDELLLIIRNKPNITLLKITKEFKNIQIFWLRNLIINITQHHLNPKYKKLSEPEIEGVLKQYHLTSRFQLPLMLNDDPISKYFGFKSGTVCEITRNSNTNGDYISYRCVK